MNIGTELSFMVRLNATEFNIISKALRCCLKDNEKHMAETLARVMAEQKASQIRSRLHELEKLENNL